MPEYKFHYFNFRGRGEACRILLVLAGAYWEDIRTEFGDDFLPLKEKFPYGQLPVLEVDGTLIGQSMAILRYLSKKYGFVPSTSLQVAIADSIVDQIQDCISKLIPIWIEKDPTKKEELNKDFKETFIPKNMKYFEKILEENSAGKCFFFGEKITYADVCFFDFCNSFLGLEGALEVPNFLKTNFQALAKLYEGVMNESIILDYLKKRPVTKL